MHPPPAESPESGVTVTGSGSAAAAVDRVTIQLGIEIVRPQPGDAFAAAAATVTRVLSVLADGGVDARSVRTADLSLRPRTEYLKDRQVLVGYEASQQLIARLGGLHGADRLLTDVATQAGEGVRIDGVSLTADNPEAALTAARAAAFADASRKAAHFAALAGRPLGRVEWIREGVPDRGPRPIGLAGRAQMAESMPLATGDAVLSVEVTAHWSFGA